MQKFCRTYLRPKKIQRIEHKPLVIISKKKGLGKFFYTDKSITNLMKK